MVIGDLNTAQIDQPVGLVAVPASPDISRGDLFVTSYESKQIQRLTWSNATEGEVRVVLCVCV